jgi:hypothetical protein
MLRARRSPTECGQRTIAALAMLSAGWLCPYGLPADAQEPPSQFRSLTDVRPRIPDEHDRPYFRETQSHRGWEIREPQFTVFAATSADDARLAAAHVSQAWNQAAALSLRWTKVVDNPDFGLSALQVVIDKEPVRDRDAPLTTVNVVGIRTQVQINAGPGQPSLEQQLLRVREGAAFAALHAAGLDSAATPWVVAGLASHAGRAGLTPEELKQYGEPVGTAHFGGQQWRFERSADDTLDYQRIDHQAAAGQVAFLLTGNDAANAPAFIQALQQRTTLAASAAAEGAAFARFPGNPQPVRTGTSFDQLAGSLASEFAAWKDNPLAGQPVIEPAQDASADLIVAQREMLVLLKLQQRFSTSDKASSVAAQPLSGRTRTKIVTFDKQKGAASSSPSTQPALTLSYAALVARLTDPAQPAWGTLDVDGSLLLSTDTKRVNELLGGFEQRYSVEQQKDRTVLVRRLEGQRTVSGWLDENPKDKTRPLAKFEVVDQRSKAKSAPAANQERQVRVSP